MDLSVVVGRVLKVRKERGKETDELFEERISRWESSSELPLTSCINISCCAIGMKVGSRD